MTACGAFFEVGEVLDRTLLAHLTDVWNALDVVTLVLLLLWFACRLSAPHHAVARGFLAVSAVPMSLSLLRFLSTFQYLGQLVIIIFAMSQVRRDLGPMQPLSRPY